MASPVPIDELDIPPEDLPLICDRCGKAIEDEACFGDDVYLHSDCYEAIEEELRKKAEEFARAHCEITRKLQRFDASQRWACTTDDYEVGRKESYTENSVRVSNRHNCTNYEELLPDRLDDSMWARALYGAIHERVEELLDNADDDQYEDADDDQ